MSLETRFFGSVVYPAYHALRRSGVLPRIAQYERDQWLSVSELRWLQAERLGTLLRHAVANVPYYREHFGYAGTRELSADDLASFAPLTKADIRTGMNTGMKDLLAQGVQRDRLQWTATSGSTGEPLCFYLDQRSETCRKATVVRSRRWMGISPGDRELLLWGSPIDATRAARLRGRLHAWLTRARLVSAYDVSPARLHACIDVIHSFRPKLLTAYPSVLEELARVLADAKRKPRSVRAIVVSAETLYPHQRELFERVFGAPVFNRYGCREVGDIALECSQHSGLHINSDRVLVEVVRDDLSPCAPGEIGNVLVTDLENYAMPLIRYQITDRAAFAEPGECACGRGLPRLEQVEGRTFDVIRFPNGSMVGGTYWTILLRRRPDRPDHGMDQFQVVQRQPGGVVIRYVAAAALNEDAARAIRRQVAVQAGPNFRVDFERVERITVNVAGKRRMVINELPSGVAGSSPQATFAPMTEEIR